MSRCDYCKYRNTWDCEEWHLSNDCFCEEFKLDFDTLSDKQQKAIQKRLMNGGER